MIERRGTVPLYCLNARQVVCRHVVIERKMRRRPQAGVRVLEQLGARFGPMMVAIVSEVKDGNW